MDDSTFDAKRRNLLAISVVLCFIKYAKASILPSATISSFSISISRPEAINHLLWLLWGYFFIRAYQHFFYHLSIEYQRSIQKTLVPILHGHGTGVGIPLEHESYIFQELERFHKYELRFVWRKLPSYTLNLVLGTIFWSIYFIPIAIRWWLKSRRFQRPVRRIATFNLLAGLKRDSVLLHRLKEKKVYPWNIRIWTISTGPSEAPEKMSIKISAIQPISFTLGAWLYLRISTRLTLTSAPFFDYRLPFILALLAPNYWLFF